MEFLKYGDKKKKLCYNQRKNKDEDKMIISRDPKYTNNTNCVVALGCFDGVHKGHASVITAAVKRASELSVPSCVWSFSEPPRRFYNPDSAPLLTTQEEKTNIIDSLGTDIYVSIDFNKDIASLLPEEFFERFIVTNLKASCIVCGYNFTFGRNGKGNIGTLKDLCKKNSVELIPISPIEINGTPVSSSNIRNYILSGEMEQAALLLGRNYSLTEKILPGKHLGRNLGFPTINQKFPSNACIPAHGVYLTKIKVNSSVFYGITNVGTQPTVCGNEVVCETNIFDFSDDIYGSVAKVEFLSFIRPERKFNSVEELSRQVHNDISRAQNMAHKLQKKHAE